MENSSKAAAPGNTAPTTISAEDQAAQWLKLAGVEDKDSGETKSENTAENGDDSDWDSVKEVPFKAKNMEEALRRPLTGDSVDAGTIESKDRAVERLLREEDDASVLLSFCDLETTEKIIQSDAYGTILEKSNLTIRELFEADALFDEKYDPESGHSLDGGWRFDQYGRRFRTPDISFKKRLRQAQYGLDADVERANDAFQTISVIAQEYYGEESDPEVTKSFEKVVQYKSEEGRINNEGGEFLLGQYNIVADRLFCGTSDISPERARKVAKAASKLDKESIFNNFPMGPEDETQVEDFVSRMAYVYDSIERYRDDLGYDDLNYDDDNWDYIKEAISSLETCINENLQYIVDLDYDSLIDKHPDHVRSDLGICVGDIILEYYDPFHMAKDLNEYNYSSFVEDTIIDPERVPASMVRRCRNYWEKEEGIWSGHLDSRTTDLICENARELKHLDVEDDTIMSYIDFLTPLDFTQKQESDGRSHEAYRLIDAGVDKELILAKTFTVCHVRDRGGGFPDGLFDPYMYDGYKGHYDSNKYSEYNKRQWDYPEPNGVRYSKAELLERAGFSITEVAETVSPEDIVENLQEFIDRGADLKEITKYMMSYKEVVVQEPGHYPQVKVYDRNRPKKGVFRPFGKNYVNDSGEPGEIMYGYNCVAKVLDTLVKHGVTEEDIFKEMPKELANADTSFMEQLVNCEALDKNKVMELGYNKFRDRILGMYISGVIDKDTYAVAVNKDKYYATMLKNIKDKS